MKLEVRIEIAETGDQTAISAVRILWREYAKYLLTLLGPEHVNLNTFDTELERLPGEYAPPRGALLLAHSENIPAGCVGVRTIDTLQGCAAFELRRLWASPGFRQLGIGRMLLDAAMDWVKRSGGSGLYLDSVADKMPEAVRLYRATGFRECDRYNKNSIPGIAFFHKTVV